MRRLVVLGVLLAVMFGLTALKTDLGGVYDPLTLAAIGFVMLAAFTVSEIGSLLKLPRVTGYILTGVALGPSAANILSSEVVGEMRMFNTLALGLIAMGAGLELDLPQLRKVWKTLFATIGSKLLLAVGLVGATMLGAQAAFHLLPLQSQGQVLAMAMVMGALSLGTSPAIVLAVLNESRSKGRLSDLVLGAAVLKDLVVVVVLAVAVAVSRTLMVPDAELDSSVLGAVGRELGGSILAGGLLGVLLILYVRYVRAEMLLFVAAMILVVSELGRALHLELLLVFIAAGFVVRNFSRYEHELMNPLSLVSLPVFVVFFTNAGASVDLLTTWRILPLAAALFAARAVAYYASARLGGGAGKEAPAIRDNAWLAYLPQAGVTLGLVGLAAQQLPELAGPISSTGMAVVALNLLVGPVTLRRALRVAGEIPESAGQPAPEQPVSPSVRPPTSVPVPSGLLPDLSTIGLDQALARIEHPVLRRAVDDFQLVVSRSFERFFAEHVSVWSERALRELDEVLPGDKDPDASELVAWLQRPREADAQERGAACRALHDALSAAVRDLPSEVDVPLELRHRSVQAGDTRRIRLRKRTSALWRFLTFRRVPQRDVPLRLVGRVALEPALAHACLRLLAAWCTAEVELFVEVRACSIHPDRRAELCEQMERRLREGLQRARQEFEAHIAQGMVQFANLVAEVGGPTLPPSRVRYSAVEPRVREAMRRLDEEPRAWVAKLLAARGVPLLSVLLLRVQGHLARVVDEFVVRQAVRAVDGELPVIREVGDRLAEVRKSLAPDRPPTEVEIEGFLEACREAYPDAAALQIARAGGRLRPAASVHRVAVSLRELVQSLPERISVLRHDTDIQKVQGPRDVTARTVALRDLATQILLRSFLPALDERVEQASSVLGRAGAEVHESLDVALNALEAYQELSASGTEEEKPLRLALERASERLTSLQEAVSVCADDLRRDVESTAGERLQALQGEAQGTEAPGALVLGETIGSRFWRSLEKGMLPLQVRASQLRTKFGASLVRWSGSELSRDIQLRYAKTVLDSAEIWTYASRWRGTEGVPETYVRLFSPEPVRDHRRFTAHHDLLETLLAAERSWLSGGPGSALVVGQHGAGRTSLLNLCELEMRAPRLARLQRDRAPRETGLIGALAAELGCRPRVKHVAAALQNARTIVIIDDLEHWFAPDLAGLRDLERFLSLVISTRHEAFFLVATCTECLELIEEALPVRHAFGHVVTLQPLKRDALIHAIEARHQLSGCPLTYPRTFASRLLGRFQKTTDRAMFFRVLAASTEGNLARAMAAWLRSVQVHEDGTVSLRVQRALSLGFPFVGQLGPRDVALLVQALRFGPMAPARLAAALGVPRDQADRHVAFLIMAGLLEPVEPSGDEVQIPRTLLAPILVGLRDVGAWP